jgi:glycosyltransferase involved in cell wall biosynthesis
MKLIIQIPCLNEEGQLADTLADLPTSVEGVDTIEVLVIDDGSTDRTVDVAKAAGAHHIVSLPTNLGLAQAFQIGLHTALALGADIIVNTDADNQYPGDAIADLVAPLIAQQADVVIGDRGVGEVADFSPLKRRLQVLGSRVVSAAAGTEIPDATSGFRAYTRRAAQSLIVVNRYTYTIESAIQASKRGLTIASIPIGKNEVTRSSRLFRSMRSYIRKSVGTIVRVFAAYEPLRFFGAIAAILMVGSLISFTPFLADWILNGDRGGHLQSIILGAILMLGAIQVAALGVMGDLIHAHRAVTERTLEAVRRLESVHSEPPAYLVATTDHRFASALPDDPPTVAGASDAPQASASELGST